MKLYVLVPRGVMTYENDLFLGVEDAAKFKNADKFCIDILPSSELLQPRFIKSTGHHEKNLQSVGIS